MARETFDLTISDVGDDVLVSCDGELDVDTADRFRASMDWVVALHPERVHLDCSGIRFVDSMGIRMMMQLTSSCRQKGIALTLSTSPEMQRLFDTIGVSEFFSSAS